MDGGISSTEISTCQVVTQIRHYSIKFGYLFKMHISTNKEIEDEA